MSKVEFCPEINNGVAEIVKYRVRRINDWVSHRIPVSRRKVIRGNVYQNIRRWSYEDTEENISASLAIGLNAIEIKQRFEKEGMK